jgi:PqqD family protein of HPr-rel-A system
MNDPGPNRPPSIVPDGTAERLAQLSVTDAGFVFDPRSGSSYSLNETGIRLFELLKGNQSEEEIRAAMTTEFDVTTETLERDLFDFLCQLKALSLLD